MCKREIASRCYRRFRHAFHACAATYGTLPGMPPIMRRMIRRTGTFSPKRIMFRFAGVKQVQCGDRHGLGPSKRLNVPRATLPRQKYG